jgi:hypothetical protein
MDALPAKSLAEVPCKILITPFQPLPLAPHSRVEFEDREPDQSLLSALESFRPAALGPAPNWAASVDAELIVNLGKYRRYDYTSLRDLLRVVRNKKNHFREMPEALQRTMGPVPDGYFRWGSKKHTTAPYRAAWVAAQSWDVAPPGCCSHRARDQGLECDC